MTAARTEIEYQRALHRRAQAGDERAMEALYWSMLPLIKSRVRRVLERETAIVGEWYDRDDLIQDAYLVFHRFVMACDPDVPLYRLLAGAFERSLRTYLRRHGPLHRQLKLVPEPPGGLEETLDCEKRFDGSNGFERTCARELLDALPSETEREIVRLGCCRRLHRTGRSLRSWAVPWPRCAIVAGRYAGIWRSAASCVTVTQDHALQADTQVSGPNLLSSFGLGSREAEAGAALNASGGQDPYPIPFHKPCGRIVADTVCRSTPNDHSACRHPSGRSGHDA